MEGREVLGQLEDFHQLAAPVPGPANAHTKRVGNQKVETGSADDPRHGLDGSALPAS
jgi:hypothetical protein